MAVETKAEKKNSATFTRFKKQMITIRRQHNTPHRKPVGLSSLWAQDIGAETGNGDRQNRTMAEFRWIQMSSFLTLLLCVTGRDGYGVFRHTGTTSQQNCCLVKSYFPPTAVTRQQRRNIVVRNGREEILSCGNTPDHQEKCDSTEWTFRASKNSSVVHQQTGGRAIEALAWTVTEECSLVIPKVQAKDAGQYTCKRPGRDPVHFYVSVITSKYTRSGTIFCFLHTTLVNLK